MKKTYDKIKKLLSETPIMDLPIMLKEYETDDRATVKKMISVYNRKYEAFTNEFLRLQEMNRYENGYYNKGVKYIAGVDEVGRGPLAGPVVTSAVILPKDCVIAGINDSKKLSAKQREELFAEIDEKAVAIGIGIIPSKIVDDINIRQATLMAMKKAVADLKITPQVVLVDAETIPGLPIMQEAIIKGDAKSVSIAAASIIAKVTRDRMMIEYAGIYPEYDFANNKGYGSASHMCAIEKFGICPIHRKSFTTESKKIKV